MQRYQDFVIKDGKWVGKFEEMYRKFDDPWLQTSRESHENSLSRSFAIRNLKKYGIRSVVEWGCGLGYYTDLIERRTGIRVRGVDISETAVAKARGKFPKLDFVVDNARNIARHADFSAILFAEITWYVLPDLRFIFDEMARCFRGKYFLQNLVFYKGGGNVTAATISRILRSSSAFVHSSSWNGYRQATARRRA